MLIFFKVKFDRELCLLLQFQALRLDMAFSWIWWGQADLLEDKEEISRHAKDCLLHFIVDELKGPLICRSNRHMI
jgi:hypothetical protein